MAFILLIIHITAVALIWYWNVFTRMDKKKVTNVIKYYLLTIYLKCKKELRGILSITFPHNCQIYLGICLKAEPTCLTQLVRNHVPAH